jgi:hypothetical protein
LSIIKEISFAKLAPWKISMTPFTEISPELEKNTYSPLYCKNSCNTNQGCNELKFEENFFPAEVLNFSLSLNATLSHFLSKKTHNLTLFG